MKFILYLISTPKTLYFNFKYFKFKQAIKLPVFVAYNVWLKKTEGVLKIKDHELKRGMIRVGFGEVGIFDKRKSRTIWEHEKNGEIVFGGKANIGHGSKISVSKNSKLMLGSNFTITAESSIVCQKKIIFGKDCLLSWDILVMDSDFHKIKDAENHHINESKEIIIGERVWISCRSLILKGSIISNDTIIGANSFVNKKFSEENTLIVGNPAEVRKKNVTWEK